MWKALNSIRINIRNLIALIVVLSITGIILMGYFKAIPDSNKELISGAVNQYLAVGFAVVIAYFFVASKTETDRQKHIQAADSQDFVVLTQDHLDQFPSLVQKGYVVGDTVHKSLLK